MKDGSKRRVRKEDKCGSEERKKRESENDLKRELRRRRKDVRKR